MSSALSMHESRMCDAFMAVMRGADLHQSPSDQHDVSCDAEYDYLVSASTALTDMKRTSASAAGSRPHPMYQTAKGTGCP